MSLAPIRVLALVGCIAVLPRAVVAACVGDCDGQDGVMINEVVSTVNIFLGNTAAATCPNADRNADGEVTIDEVVAAVNSFLVGPSACPLVTFDTPSPTETVTAQPSNTATPTLTADVLPTATEPPTATLSTVAPSATTTLTPIPTVTRTPTATATRSATATPTPTATATATATPAGSPTPRPAVCNNGVLENGETCAKCAMDCKVKSCTATSPLQTFGVVFAPPPGQDASSVTALVGYKSDVISIPGKGTGSCSGGSKDGKACSTGTDCPNGQCVLPKSRVKNTPPGSIVGVNDLDYAVRVVLTRSGQIAPGRIFTVDFDGCQGAAAATTAAFGCTVEGCATSFGPIDGCTCTVVTP